MWHRLGDLHWRLTYIPLAFRALNRDSLPCTSVCRVTLGSWPDLFILLWQVKLALHLLG